MHFLKYLLLYPLGQKQHLPLFSVKSGWWSCRSYLTREHGLATAAFSATFGVETKIVFKSFPQFWTFSCQSEGTSQLWNECMECCLVLFLEFLIDHSGDGKVATNWTWRYMQRVKNYFNPIQDGSFQGCSRMGVGKSLPVPKICRTMIKLGTVLALLKKIQKIYKSCGTPFVHWWH